MKFKLFILLICYWGFNFVIYPQSTTSGSYSSKHNYIRKIEYQNASGTQYLENIQYFDGLGRPNQNIQRGYSNSKKDLIVLTEYDTIGRDSLIWLPGLSTNNGLYENPDKIKNSASLANNDQKPYSKLIYDNSPLNRIVENYGSGEARHKYKKSLKTEYLTNTGTSGHFACINFKVIGNGENISLTKGGYYSSGDLYVIKTIDEDDNVSYLFKDKLSRTLLTRKINGNISYDTYYVHNDLGRLCYVLPPIASQKIIEKGVNNSVIETWGYIYKYDEYNRCIYRKIPGCEPTLYVYDKVNNLIFTQNGEQRFNKPQPLWTYNKYDSFGRLIITGLHRTDDSHKALRDKCSEIIVSETQGNSTTTYCGYTWNSLSNDIRYSEAYVLLVNYYDDYDHLLNQSENFKNNLSYTVRSGYGTLHNNAKGYIVGRRARHISKVGELTNETVSAIYYDINGRIIQTKSTNHMGGIDEEYFDYNFTGQPIKKIKIHSAKNEQTLTEYYSYEYDHAGRLLKTKHKLGTGVEMILAENTYDELGRIKINKKANNNFLSTTYSYNVRSWITGIKSDKFKQDLYYNTYYSEYGPSTGMIMPIYTYNTPKYSGDVTAIKWSVHGDKERSYTFNYDNLSQLKSSKYWEKGTLADKDAYGTSYSYDKHGNVTSIKRKGKTSSGTTIGYIDDLTVMTYNGNQLTFIKDAATSNLPAESSDFRDRSSSNVSIEYCYNLNGALSKDYNKGIDTICYNVLDLPYVMVINSNSSKAKNYYTYNSLGVKLRQEQRYDPYLLKAPIHSTNPTNDGLIDYEIKDYVNNIVYETSKRGTDISTKTKIMIEGGYIEGNTYHFFLTDHLGNNRVVVEASGTNTQINHYYPFGMSFYADGGVKEQAKQSFKYNNKELDQMHALKWYDYGARLYDPSYCRFTTVDPLAEKYYSTSPYAYVKNNPLKFIDPDGRKLINTISPNSHQALFYIAKIAATSLGNHVLSTLIDTNQKYSLNETMLPRMAAYSPLGRQINYPQFTWESIGIDIEGGSNKTEYWIGHEAFHAYDHENKQFTYKNMAVRREKLEPRAVSFENYLRKVYNNTPYRTSYGKITGDFYQYNDIDEKITNFKYLGNNAPNAAKDDGLFRLGASFTQTIDGVSINRFIIVTQGNKGEITYKFLNNEHEYKEQTKNW